MLQTKNYYVFAFQPYKGNFNFGGRHLHVYIWMNWTNMRFFQFEFKTLLVNIVYFYIDFFYIARY